MSECENIGCVPPSTQIKVGPIKPIESIPIPSCDNSLEEHSHNVDLKDYLDLPVASDEEAKRGSFCDEKLQPFIPIDCEMKLDNMLKKLEKGLCHHIYSDDDVEHDVGVIGDVLIELIKYLKDKENEQ